MRILFIMTSLEADVAEAAEAKMMIKALLELGYVVGGLYVQGMGTTVVSHLQFVPCPVPYAQRRSTGAIKTAIQTFQPDDGHIVASWNPFHVRASNILRKLHIPYLVEPGGGMAAVCLDHRFGEKPCNWYHKITRRLYKRFYDLRMLKNATLIRAMAPFEAQDLKSRFGLESEVLPLGFNPEWVTEVRLRRTTATRPVHFAFVGRVEIFQKGLDLILAAVRKLNSEGLSSAFTVTLAGPEVNYSFTRIPKYLQEHGITNVTLRGAVHGEEKQQLLEKSDVFLHPSRCEQIAKMVREATGAGLAVIASEDSHYGELAKANGLGLLAGLTVDDMAAAMKTFIDHPESAFTMGKMGAEFARAWSWQKVASELVVMYGKMLRRVEALT